MGIFEIVETCAYLQCEPNTPADIKVHVFVPGGSYPLWVCSEDHFEKLVDAGAEHGADVVKARGGTL